jgi:hypothetical protein
MEKVFKYKVVVCLPDYPSSNKPEHMLWLRYAVVKDLLRFSRWLSIRFPYWRFFNAERDGKRVTYTPSNRPLSHSPF